MSNLPKYDVDDMSDEEYAKEYDWSDEESYDEMDDAEEVLIEDDSNIASENEETKKVDLPKSFFDSINEKGFVEIIREKQRQSSMEFDSDDGDAEINIKGMLNEYLEQIEYYDIDKWNSAADDIGSSSQIENGVAAAKRIYQTVGVKILKQTAINNNWELATNSDKEYINIGKHWIEFSSKIQIMFIQKAMNRLGIPEMFILTSKFVEMFHKQLLFNRLFKPMKPKIGTFINLQNGTLKIGLDGVRLLPHNPNDFMLHLLDYSYDPNSVNLLWKSFLDVVLPNLDTQKTLQQSIAYTFIKGLKLEKAIFLFGTGANGKSVVFEIFRMIIDSSMMTNYSLESLLDSKGYHRYNIQNKHINYASDIDFKFLNNGIFKQLVSGEPVEARLPGGVPVIIDDCPKLMFNINSIDGANIESTLGFLRRMLFIPFEITIPEDQWDKELPQKILLNKSGVLNWIIEGIQEVLNNKNIFISNQCEQFLDNFQKSSNLTARFFEECLISNFDNEIKFQDMYDIFREYCKKQGEHHIAQKIFNAELRKIIQDKRTKYGYRWLASFNKANCQAMSISVSF